MTSTSYSLSLLLLAILLQLASTLPMKGRNSEEPSSPGNLEWKFNNDEELLAIINKMEPGLGATILRVYQKGWLGEFGDDEQVQRRHLIENIHGVTGQDVEILQDMANEQLVGIFSELNS